MSSSRSDISSKKGNISLEKKESKISELANEFVSDLFGDSPKNRQSIKPVPPPKGKNTKESKKPSDSDEENSGEAERDQEFEREERKEEKKKGYSPNSKKKTTSPNNRSQFKEPQDTENSPNSFRRDQVSMALVPVEEPEAKTFVTQKREEEKQPESSWTLNDLLFPGGKIAKLCRISNPKNKDINISEIFKRSGILENNPVILLSGAEGDKRAGLLVGIARAAYSTDAVIIDNGLKSGIETACFRKKVKLVGICPEEAIVYPTKSSTGDRLGELAAGHSHLFVIGSKGDNMRWDNVVPFKMELCERIKKGRGGPGSFQCRGVCVLVGDSTSCTWEVEKALKAGWPVLVIEASPLGRDIAAFLKGGHSNVPKTLQEPLKKGKVFVFPEAGTAEHLASAVHLHLAISF